MEQQQFTVQLTPKKIFWGGAAAGALGVMTLGFVLTLLAGGNPLAGLSLPGLGSRPSLAAAGGPAPSPDDPSLGQPAAAVKPVGNDDHVRGGKNAEVTVIEYSDFECPFCKRFHPTMMQVMDAYKDKVRWVYRHFPLSFHANAQKEAEAAECANELGGNDAFWKYTDKIFERTTSNGTGFPLENLVPLAKELGLNESKFRSCLDSGKYAPHIQQDMDEGSAAGVTGTPGSFVIGKSGEPQLIPGALPFSSMQPAIDAALAES